MIEDYNIFAITNPLYSITFLMMHEGNSVKRGRGKELLLVGWVVHKKQRGLCLPIFLSCLRGAQTSIFSLLFYFRGHAHTQNHLFILFIFSHFSFVLLWNLVHQGWQLVQDQSLHRVLPVLEPLLHMSTAS